MAEPGDKSLMPLIRPPAINLSLKFQHVNVISELFCLCNKQYLNWHIKAAKRSTVTSIANWSNTTSEENALRATGEEQPNRFSRGSLKFASSSSLT